MTEQQHPITPPPLELVDAWEKEANQSGKPRLDYIATQAGRCRPQRTAPLFRKEHSPYHTAINA